MSDIQSNYPRVTVAQMTEKVDLVSVNDSAFAGNSVVSLITTLIVCHSIGPDLGFASEKYTTIYGLMILIVVGLAFFYFVNLFRWTSRAHQAVCLLRGYSPKISSTLVGIGSALSLVLCYIPVWLAFDFLITHSDPENSDYPSFSWSPAALHFMVPLVLSSAWLVLQFIPVWSATVLLIMHFVRYALLVYAVWAGCRLVRRTTENLVKLARIVREQSAPPTETVETLS